MHHESQFYLVSIFILVSLSAFVNLSAQQDEELEANLLRLMPKQRELNDWRILSEPRFFGPDNLFEYIDGEADLYLLYGFRGLITADLTVDPDSRAVNVQIYCMKSPTHAFGIFAAERSPEEKPIDIGIQGYMGANVLNCYKGPYYVKMMSFILSQNLMASLEKMGRTIADKIPGEYKEPELFRYFPVENKVTHSERYIPTGFLGQSYLQNGYRCDYESDQGTYQIFLVPLDSDTAAQTVLKKYRVFLESQDYRILHQGDDETIVAEKNGFILAFAYRSYLGGLLDIKNLEQGQTIIGTVKNNLIE